MTAHLPQFHMKHDTHSALGLSNLSIAGGTKKRSMQRPGVIFGSFEQQPIRMTHAS